jgi:hypothetical protein
MITLSCAYAYSTVDESQYKFDDYIYYALMSVYDFKKAPFDFKKPPDVKDPVYVKLRADIVRYRMFFSE